MKKNMKTFLMSLLAIAIIIACLSFGVSAAEITSGDYTFTRLNSNGLRITAYSGSETEVVIPETIDGYTVESIYNVSGIFAVDSGVTSVTVPATVNEVYGGSFRCNTLKEIIVDENNRYYESIEGVLYTEDMKTLVTYPAAKEGSFYTVPLGVEKIGQSAFRYNTLLKEVVLPPNLTTIDYYAFWGCSGLEKMTLPYEITTIKTWAFNGCTNLYLVVPNSITNIDDFVSNLVTFNNDDGFVKCIVTPKSDFYTALEEKLKEKNLYNIWEGNTGTHAQDYGYEYIGPFRFTTYKGKAILRDVDENAEGALYIPSSAFGYPVISIFDKSFLNCDKITELFLPDTITEVNSGALSGLENLEKITLSKNLTTASYMFSNLPSITSFESPEGLKVIPYAFFANSNIESIVLNEGVETIGAEAFYNTKITEITIPASVTLVEEEAFSGTSYLKEIKVAEGSENYCSVDGVLYTKDMKTLVAYPIQKTDEKYVVPETVTAISNAAFLCNLYLKEVVLPEGLESIGEAAFNSCINLEKVNIPSKIKVIEEYTFGGCSKIKAIELPASLIEIKDYAFSGLYYITSVEFPDSVEYIGKYAFSSCFSIKKVKIPASVVTIEKGAFDDCISLSELELLSVEATEIPLENRICSVIPENFDLNAYIECIIEYDNLLGALLSGEYGDLTENELLEKLEAKEVELNAFGLNMDEIDYSRMNITAHYYYDLRALAVENGANYNILSHDLTYVWYTEVDEATVETIAYEANCESEGYALSVTCDVCGLIGEYVYIPALHDEVILNAKAATCTEAGYTGDIVCDVCETEFVKGNEISPINHANAVLQNAAEATCKKPGYTGDIYCPNCKKIIEIGTEISLLPHKEEIIPAVAVACTTNGYTEGKKCSVCDEVLIAPVVIPAEGHIKKDIVVTAPTCTNYGITKTVCEACGDKIKEFKVDALGHKDNDKDGNCDLCKELLCSCNCHKTGFMGFIWKIINFFQKLFKIEQYCDCGVQHW